VYRLILRWCLVYRVRSRGESTGVLDPATRTYGRRTLTKLTAGATGAGVLLFLAGVYTFPEPTVAVSTLPPQDSMAPGWLVGIGLILAACFGFFVAGFLFRATLSLRSDR
jgi:hypothetical protein